MSISINTFKSCYIVGIGGSGMSSIAKYLFQHFDFNSIISNCSKNKKHLFFSDKNRHQVEFAVYLRAPELNSFWDGTQIRFSGKNAIRFYQLIRQQKTNSHLFKTQNFKLAKLNKKSYKIIDSNLDIKKNEDLIINQIKKLIK